MFMLKIPILLWLCTDVFGGVPQRPTNLPCKLNDESCKKTMMQWAYSSTIAGVPELNIPSSDPMNHEKIKGDLGYVKYTLTKTTVDGFKFCKINKARFNSNVTNMQIEFLCPRFHMDGDYNITGNLLNYVIKGEGTYYVDTTNYLVMFDTEIKHWKKDGKTHGVHEKYKFGADLLGELDVELRYLFGGKKELSDPIHKFAKKNARTFSALLHDPILEANLQKFLKYFNRFFREIPIAELLQVKL